MTKFKFFYILSSGFFWVGYAYEAVLDALYKGRSVYNDEATRYYDALAEQESGHVLH